MMESIIRIMGLVLTCIVAFFAGIIIEHLRKRKQTEKYAQEKLGKEITRLKKAHDESLRVLRGILPASLEGQFKPLKRHLEIFHDCHLGEWTDWLGEKDKEKLPLNKDKALSRSN